MEMCVQDLLLERMKEEAVLCFQLYCDWNVWIVIYPSKYLHGVFDYEKKACTPCTMHTNSLDYQFRNCELCRTVSQHAVGTAICWNL